MPPIPIELGGPSGIRGGLGVLNAPGGTTGLRELAGDDTD